MALWQVVAPDRDRVVLCEGYIRHELKHGSYVRSENIVRMFPEFFVRILEENEMITPKETETVTIEETEKETETVTIEETEKETEIKKKGKKK